MFSILKVCFVVCLCVLVKFLIDCKVRIVFIDWMDDVVWVFIVVWVCDGVFMEKFCLFVLFVDLDLVEEIELVEFVLEIFMVELYFVVRY